MRYEGDIEELIANATGERIPDRSKDRLSYTQSHYQIDLTQVTQVVSVNVNPFPSTHSSHANDFQGVNRTDKEHELEIEVSTSAIMDQGRRAANNEPNEYLSLVEGLIDNVRVLSRAVPLQ